MRPESQSRSPAELLATDRVSAGCRRTCGERRCSRRLPTRGWNAAATCGQFGPPDLSVVAERAQRLRGHQVEPGPTGPGCRPSCSGLPSPRGRSLPGFRRSDVQANYQDRAYNGRNTLGSLQSESSCQDSSHCTCWRRHSLGFALPAFGQPPAAYSCSGDADPSRLLLA